MAKEISIIRQEAQQVQNATQVGENTAQRVGGVLVDIVDKAEEHETDIDNLNSNTGVDDYPVFSGSTAYSAGDVVNYNGLLYQFTSDHAAGAWTGSDIEDYSMKKNIDNILTKSLSAANSVKTGSQEKDISSSAIRWVEGVWNYTKSESEGSTYQKETFKHGFFNVSTYDKITIANAGFNGSASSTAENTLPNISLYSGDTPLAFKHGEASEAVEFDLTPYVQYPDLIAIITVKKDADFSIKVSSEGLLPQIEALKEEVSSSFGDLTNLKVKVDGIDKDILTDLQWEKASWRVTAEHPNGEKENYSSIQKRWCTDKIDISSYEYVACKGLLNGSPNSNATKKVPGVLIYGNGNLVDMIISADGTNTIYRSDYAQYKTLEAIFQCKSTSDDEFISIYATSSIHVFRNPVSSETSIPKRVVIVGDSLCGNRSALIIKQFDAIFEAQGYDPIISRAMGGENAIGNLTRAGGLGIRVKTAFDIPKSGTVSCELQSAWMKSDGTYADNPYNRLNGDGAKVSICGVTGYIQKTSSGYTFTRSEPGEVVKVGQGAIIYDSALIDDKDYVHIWFTGQNGGYEDEKDWAGMVKSATMNFNDRFIVCSTPHDRTTPELVRQANIHFGCRYLNLRDYTKGQAVYDGQRLGIIDSGYTADDYEQLFWPESDKIHQNNLLSYIWAVKMWNLLLDFKFVEGSRINTGDYYLP